MNAVLLVSLAVCLIVGQAHAQMGMMGMGGGGMGDMDFNAMIPGGFGWNAMADVDFPFGGGFGWGGMSRWAGPWMRRMMPGMMTGGMRGIPGMGMLGNEAGGMENMGENAGVGANMLG